MRTENLEQNLCKDKPKNNSPLASSKSKGERLKRIRHLANLSREEFCLDSDINLPTLISWEVGRFGGLSLKGAKKVITRVAREGVFCTLEWLLYEVGSGPEVRTDYKKANHIDEKFINNQNKLDENSIIIEELMLFRKLNDQHIDFIINDDAMAPHYQPGDFVAGIKRYNDKIKSLLRLDCIVLLKSGQIVMRNLQEGPSKTTFNLVCTNLQTKVHNPIIYNVEIASAAPIIWHRRRDLTNI